MKKLFDECEYKCQQMSNVKMSNTISQADIEILTTKKKKYLTTNFHIPIFSYNFIEKNQIKIESNFLLLNLFQQFVSLLLI